MPVAGVAERVQPGGIKDASIAADYVNSLAGHYQPEVTRPWSHVAEGVRKQVQAAIDARGEFRTAGDLAAFVCRQLPAPDSQAWPAPRAAASSCCRPHSGLSKIHWRTYARS
jgi:hypothetical protein